MTECDCSAFWYHGSPQELSMLQSGSWVTQFRELAKAFSHKPALISLDDDCAQVKHNGQLAGFLYVVSEPIGPDDVTCLRDTAKTHWQTNRDLRLLLVAELPVDDPPQLTTDEVASLRQEIPEGTTAFVGTPDRE